MTQIICFEGLSPWLIGTPTYVRDGLLNRVLRGQADFDTQVWRGSFMSSGPKFAPANKIIIIGHSMGGASAISYCNRWAKFFEADLLLTLDPRPLHRPYIKPPNVKRAVNFYQQDWWMPGYPVEGATNIKVSASHIEVPALPEVREVLRWAL